jgi:hypothetical protein
VEAEVKRPRVDSKKPKVKTMIKTKTSPNPKPRDITQELKVQNGIYAAEKFSDLFSISHVVNLLVRGEYVLHTRGSTRGDTLPR